MTNRFADRVAIEISEASGDARSRVREQRGLYEPLDAIVRAVLHSNQTGWIAINQRAAVEIETETVLPAARAVGREPSIHVMRQSLSFDLRPVHRQFFDVAEASLFEVEGTEHATDAGGLSARDRCRADD